MALLKLGLVMVEVAADKADATGAQNNLPSEGLKQLIGVGTGLWPSLPRGKTVKSTNGDGHRIQEVLIDHNPARFKETRRPASLVWPAWHITDLAAGPLTVDPERGRCTGMYTGVAPLGTGAMLKGLAAARQSGS